MLGFDKTGDAVFWVTFSISDKIRCLAIMSCKVELEVKLRLTKQMKHIFALFHNGSPFYVLAPLFLYFRLKNAK